MKPKEIKTEELVVVGGPTAYELATLSARICPGLCQQTPAMAIEVAMDLIAAAEKEIQSKRELDALMIAAEKRDEEIGHLTFTPGVKFITGENVMTRAMPWFRRFIKSRTNSESQAEKQIVHRRANGFGPVKAELLRSAFAEWKLTEKSALAKKSGAVKKRKSASKPKK